MNTSTKTSKLTFLGVMLALTICFVMMTAIPSAGASMALFMFIPTFVTSILLGPKYGAIMGFAAGVCTLLKALLTPTSILDPFFINPIVSVIPRVIVGIVPYYVYEGLKRVIKVDKTESLPIMFAGALGAATNTILVIGVLYFIFAQRIIEAASSVGFNMGNSFISFIIGIGGIQCLLEATTGALLTLPVIKIYKKINK